MDESVATWLVSTIGIGNTVGRVALGYVSSLPGVDALLINNVFITACGLITALSSLSLSMGYQFFYAATFGLSICEYIYNIAFSSCTCIASTCVRFNETTQLTE